jgi:RHS repeat-associated protein
VDTSRPSLIPLAPLGVISTTTPALRGQFSSPSAIITPNLMLTLDGQSLATTTAVITSGGFSQTVSLAQGPHQLKAQIANAAGPNQNNGAWNFTVDSYTPTVSITAFQAAGRNISITWNGSDPAPGSGPLKYDVQYKVGNGPSWTGWLTQTSQVITNFVGTFGYTYTFQAQATDPAGNKSLWVQTTSPVQIERVTKYYLFGGQRVAMWQENVVYYLHGDHLGSTSLTTDASGQKVSESRYRPYGEIRFGNTGPTDIGFTSQRKDSYMELVDYGARWYDPGLGRFISPDTIIPDPANPQSLNRYSYVLNNPLRYVDPSGHTNCAADDRACWDSRYYRAHGYRKNHEGEWQQVGNAEFDDAGILSDVLGENGITLQAGDTWHFGDLSLVGQGVVALSNRVGGADRLKELLGGTVSFVRKAQGRFFGCGSDAAACAISGLFSGGTVEFYNGLFTGSDNFVRGVAVHELAHIIDFNNAIGDYTGWEFRPFWDAFAEGSRFGPSGRSISKYGQSSPQEYWAESVADWVYGPQYPSANGHGPERNKLHPLQVQWIEGVLRP